MPYLKLDFCLNTNALRRKIYRPIEILSNKRDVTAMSIGENRWPFLACQLLAYFVFVNEHESLRQKVGKKVMLYWTIVFLVIAIVAGALGFFGIAGAAAGIAKILFFVFLVLFIVALVAGRSAV